MSQNAMSTAGYWDRRAAAMDADIAAEREYMTSPLGQLEAARRRGDTAEIARLQAAMDAETEQQWTRETTIARRAEWNAWIQSGAATKAGRLDLKAVRARERAQGWDATDLKAAIARHGL